MTKVDFRLKWGPQWDALVHSQMWEDAMTTAEQESSILRFSHLTNEQIDKEGAFVLKGMQGWMKFASELEALADKPLQYEPNVPVTYPDPIKEANELALQMEKPKSRKKAKV
jgi:hypothetical protein